MPDGVKEGVCAGDADGFTERDPVTVGAIVAVWLAVAVSVAVFGPLGISDDIGDKGGPAEINAVPVYELLAVADAVIESEPIATHKLHALVGVVTTELAGPVHAADESH